MMTTNNNLFANAIHIEKLEARLELADAASKKHTTTVPVTVTVSL